MRPKELFIDILHFLNQKLLENDYRFVPKLKEFNDKTNTTISPIISNGKYIEPKPISLSDELEANRYIAPNISVQMNQYSNGHLPNNENSYNHLS